MCALAMMSFAAQAQDEVLYDISTTPATAVVADNIYLLANRANPEMGLAYDENGATVFEPVSEQLGQSVTSVQNFLFTATADGFTLPVTLTNINDENSNWGYGETGGGIVLSPRRGAAASEEPTYFTVKDAAGQYVMLYNGTPYGVNATTPAPEAQWIAYEVKEHVHQWETDQWDHHCTIPGCELGEWQAHTTDENGKCTVCGHEHEHMWEAGHCCICGAACDHSGSIVHVDIIPATCTQEGLKEHYECSVCQEMFANEAGESVVNYHEYVIEKLGHDIGDDLCCHREGCDATVTIASTITLDVATKVNYMNYALNNEQDPTAEPLYKIEIATPATYTFSIPDEIAVQLSSSSICVFDKSFKIYSWVYNNPGKIFIEEAGTYYLQPNAYSPEEVEFAYEDVPLTITAVKSITLDNITDEEGNAVEITFTEEGYATNQTIAISDGNDIHCQIDFSVPEVSYTRDLSGYTANNWGTLCLPFDYTITDAEAAGLSIYEFTAASAEAVTVTRKTEGTVKYGTPVLFKKTSEGEVSSLILTATDTKMGGREKELDAIDGLVMIGKLHECGVNSGYYLDAQDGMLYSIEEWCSEQRESWLHIPAYRAFFRSASEGSGQNAPLRVDIDDETTSIKAIHALIQGTAEIFDLMGNRRSELQESVNIVNGVKVIVK